MEKVGSSDRVTIISVLSEGRDLANELKRKLHPTVGSREACDALLENILSSYENAIKLLDCRDILENSMTIPSPTANVFELPNSNVGSPVISEGSDTSSKDQPHKSKKRKTVVKCSEQVRVSSETGFEGQLDDGYNWRKYGQKDILGANHPRAYYRCTHRNTQGCLATKQVQRADEDPLVFKVIYRGKHSCMLERLQENKEKKENEEEVIAIAIGNETSLKSENREVVVSKEEDHFSSFSPENLEATFFPEIGDFNGMNYSPPFLSPATSETYFSMSRCLMNDFGNDVGEIVSNPSPYTGFSYGDLDISIDQIDFSSQFLDGIDFF